jgi:hypothetical protein
MSRESWLDGTHAQLTTFIVQACNAHADLLEALKTIRVFAGASGDDTIKAIADQAIRKATQ